MREASPGRVINFINSLKTGGREQSDRPTDATHLDSLLRALGTIWTIEIDTPLD